VFAALFVYGEDSRPSWFTAQLEYQGVGAFGQSLLFSGPVYESSGPWFGGAFDSTSVGLRQVGSMSFGIAMSQVTGRVEYTVNGVTVSKAVRRQTLHTAQFAERYDAILTMSSSGCRNPTDNMLRSGSASIAPNVSGAAISLRVDADFRICTYRGQQVQDGRFASFAATYSCTDGETGTGTFSELVVGHGTFSGRWRGVSPAKGCTSVGGFSGLDISTDLR
jgi:hypothetical protein